MNLWVDETVTIVVPLTIFAAVLWGISRWLEGPRVAPPTCEECGFPSWNLHAYKRKLRCAACMETKS